MTTKRPPTAKDWQACYRRNLKTIRMAEKRLARRR